MSIIKKIYRKLPDKCKLAIVSLYDKLYQKYEYCKYHLLMKRKVIDYLKLEGFSKVSAIQKNKWKRLPIFAQYYYAMYDDKECFIKIGIMNKNFGCISRENQVLDYLTKNGSDYLKNCIPVSVKYGINEELEIEYVATDYYRNMDMVEKGMPYQDVKVIDENLTKIYDELTQLGIVHADIRPSNLLYDGDSKKVVLFDFGISCIYEYMEEDEIYCNCVLPYDLRGIGCGRYTPEDGIIDDAYACLYTLKDIYPNYKKDFKENWYRWNKKISCHEIKMKVS